ncbi:NUDIX domain-containing protein [Oceanobacillus sp. CFH 90083]|uniref:NUDIX domain-containing protein n=1 Tax=Oceanobacillus sp. CFH 90083 TaxID=2592336 RepID=UPI00188322D7|nr:NUDIX hydrolase [Oceanobacillus sp. CFH 90083]
MSCLNHFRLYRIVSSIILENEKILLVQNKDEYANYIWSLPDGQIEAGETMKEALYREVCEETGLNVTNFEIAYIHESFISEHAAHSLVTVCNVSVKHGEHLTINDPDREIADIKWVPIREIENYIKNTAVVKPLLEWLKDRFTCIYRLDKNLVWDDRNK